MNRVWISACDVLRTVAGSNITSGHKKTVPDNDTAICIPLQDRSGNRIGHNPLLPKRFTPPKHHSRPASIFEVVHWFNGSIMESKLYKNLYYHLNDEKNPTRLIRSEFREMVSMGCALLTHYYDAITSELGFSNDKGKWVRLSYQQLANKLSVSVIRIKRFFKFLKDRGLVSIVYDKKCDDKGNWTSNISRKYLNSSFFIETLGMRAWRKIVTYKNWLLKKKKPKTKKEKENTMLLSTMVRDTLSNSSRSQQKKSLTSSVSNLLNSSKPSKYSNNISIEKNKSLIAKALDMYKQKPDKTVGDYLRDLQLQPC